VSLLDHIETNRQKLLAIVATLFAAVAHGVANRAVRLVVLRSLRPAEAAVRRLIVVAAKGLFLKPAVSRPMPPGLSRRLRLARKERVARPVFQLSDRHVPMVEPARKTYFKTGPRITVIMPPDPVIFTTPIASLPVVPVTDPSAALLRRLDAIKMALEDVPRQAQRLVRWTARRKAIAQLRPIHCSPLRVGRAPYLPKIPVSDIDYVLERCHLLAREALRSDTS
jgi:hypothetical protein